MHGGHHQAQASGKGQDQEVGGGDATLLFIITCLRGGDTHAIFPLLVELRTDHVGHARSRCARGFLLLVHLISMRGEHAGATLTGPFHR